MNDDYLAQLTNVLGQARPRLASTHRLEFKSVFGATSGYVNGSIFVSCGEFGVALRLPPETLEDVFKEEGVQPLRYFPRGHIKKEYAVLPTWILTDRRRLKKLVDASIEYVAPRFIEPG